MYIAHVIRASFWVNRSSGFLTRSDTNKAVQSQRMARSSKFRIYEVERLYYQCSENQATDQLCGYRTTDLRLCLRICKNPVFSERGSYGLILFFQNPAKYHHNSVLSFFVLFFPSSFLLSSFFLSFCLSFLPFVSFLSLLLKPESCWKKRHHAITPIKWAATWENRIFAYAKTKPQISCAVTAQLISAFVFVTWIVQSLYFLNPKFRASSYLLWLHSLVCVGPGRKPWRPVFCRRGSNLDPLKTHFYLV